MIGQSLTDELSDDWAMREFFDEIGARVINVSPRIPTYCFQCCQNKLDVQFCNGGRGPSYYCFACWKKAGSEAYNAQRLEQIEYIHRRSRNYVAIYGARLARRDGGWNCHYCGAELTIKNRTVDHIVSLKRNVWAADDIDNMVLACRSCNSKYGAR